MIHLKHFKVHDGDKPAVAGLSMYLEGDTLVAAFKQLVQQGANLWDQAPAEAKTLADLVTNGKEMQPYGQLTQKNNIT